MLLGSLQIVKMRLCLLIIVGSYLLLDLDGHKHNEHQYAEILQLDIQCTYAPLDEYVDCRFIGV